MAILKRTRWSANYFTIDGLSNPCEGFPILKLPRILIDAEISRHPQEMAPAESVEQRGAVLLATYLF